MATTNLISKSVGNILLQSGDGSPDHVAPIGSFYYNNTTNLLWSNQNGLGDGWKFMTPAIYGEINVDSNPYGGTLTTGGAINTFVSLSGLTWVNNNNLKGFTRSGQKLVLASGLTGTYRIIGTATVLRNATNGNYKFGVSINGTAPTLQSRIGANSTLTTKTAGQMLVKYDTVLNGGDTVELVAAVAVSAGHTFYIRSATLIIYRILE